MSTISKIPLNNENNLDYVRLFCESVYHLSDYNDGVGELKLSGGRIEKVTSDYYAIIDGDFAIDTSAATSDGTWYIHIAENGDNTCSAYLNSNMGTWDATKGGYYYLTAKVIMSVIKSGTSYNYRMRLESEKYVSTEIKCDYLIGDFKTNTINPKTATVSIDNVLFSDSKVSSVYSLFTGSFHATGTYRPDDVYEIFKDIVPNVGDCLKLNGCASMLAGVYGESTHVYSHVERTDIDEVTLYGVEYTEGSGIVENGNFVALDGDVAGAALIDIDFYW